MTGVTGVGLSGTELAPGEPIGHLVDASLRLGLRSVEVWYPRNTGDDPDAALRAVADAGLAVSCLGTAWTRRSSPAPSGSGGCSTTSDGGSELVAYASLVLSGLALVTAIAATVMARGRRGANAR